MWLKLSTLARLQQLYSAYALSLIVCLTVWCQNFSLWLPLFPIRTFNGDFSWATPIALIYSPTDRILQIKIIGRLCKEYLTDEQVSPDTHRVTTYYRPTQSTIDNHLQMPVLVERRRDSRNLALFYPVSLIAFCVATIVLQFSIASVNLDHNYRFSDTMTLANAGPDDSETKKLLENYTKKIYINFEALFILFCGL